VRGEGRAGELAQVLLDQVAQRPGPRGGGVPAAGGGLDRPPPLGGQVAGGVQGGEGGVQVPGREGLPALVGGLGACWSPAVPPAGAGAGWLASAVVPAGSSAGCPASVALPAPGGSAGGASSRGASWAGFQVSAMPGRLPLTRVAVPFFSQAIRACRAAAVLIPARAAMAVTAAPAGSADSAARTAAAGLSTAAGATGAGSGVVAASAALRAACGAGAGVLVRAMMVTPFLFSGAIPVFD
jgi:hypothetical protein